MVIFQFAFCMFTRPGISLASYGLAHPVEHDLPPMAQGICDVPGLVNIQKTMENHHAING